jgi:hypothetical protein
VKLQGPISDIDINEQIVWIFGVEIYVGQITEPGSVRPRNFFDRAAERDTVNVMGEMAGDSVEWKGIELLDFGN